MKRINPTEPKTEKGGGKNFFILKMLRCFIYLMIYAQQVMSRDEDPTFFSTDPDPAGKKMRIRIRLKKNADPDPTLNRNEEKIYSYFR